MAPEQVDAATVRRLVDGQQMPGPVALARQVEAVVERAPADDALMSDHGDAGPGQRLDLVRVVGDETDLPDPEQPEHGGREIEPPLVRPEAQHLVGVVGVMSLGLQPVGANLVGNAVPAALLVEVEEDAAFVLGHEAHRAAQLVAAIAFQAAEQVARQAGRVEPHRDGLRRVRAPDDHGHLVAVRRAARPRRRGVPAGLTRGSDVSSRRAA